MSARAQQWKGRIKQAAGTVTGDRRLEDEARIGRRTGAAEERVSTAKPKLREAGRLKVCYEQGKRLGALVAVLAA
jgi:uncharacterized protein YjbJ (UPF0337 family)